MKSYKIQLFFYFLFFHISFYISKYHFYDFLGFHSALCEKDFVTNFPFLTDSPQLVKDHNPLSMARVFCHVNLVRFSEISTNEIEKIF